MPAITAVIITHNEARNIQRCLESLLGVVDEMVVVDSLSTDETEEICRAYRVRFFSQPWEGYSATKNFGNEQASHPFILSIDADEALSPELKAAILSSKPDLSGGYRFARRNYYCGQWIKHGGWYPDRKLRLFPKGQAHWEGEHIHEQLVPDSGVEINALEGDLLHYTNHSLEDHLERADRYATLHAQLLFTSGKKANWVRLWLVPFYRFLRMYFLRQAFREGYLGFQLSKVSAFAVFLKYAKLKHLWDEQAKG